MQLWVLISQQKYLKRFHYKCNFAWAQKWISLFSLSCSFVTWNILLHFPKKHASDYFYFKKIKIYGFHTFCVLSNPLYSLFVCFRSDTDLYKGSGVIASPSWPRHYIRNHFSIHGCEWDIKTSSSKLIKLAIMGMDISSGYCSYEYVKIKGKLSPFLKYVTGKN